MVTVANVSSLLRRAKSLISEPELWLKKELMNETEGGFCAAGALGAAALPSNAVLNYTNVTEKIHFDVYLVFRDNKPSTLLDKARQILSSCCPPLIEEDDRGGSPPWNRIVDFNNNPATTHEMMMAAFDCAIKKAEEADKAAGLVP